MPVVEKTIEIRFGAIAPPIVDQCREQGFFLQGSGEIQRASEALAYLHISEVLTDSEVKRGRKRLMVKIIKSCKEISC